MMSDATYSPDGKFIFLVKCFETEEWLILFESANTLTDKDFSMTPALLFLTAIDLIYRWAPNSRQDWAWVTPGSLLAVFLWILLSVGLKFMVENFINYHLVYGSITGVIVLMMWLYLAGLSLLIGGELNAVLHESKTSDPAGQATR